MRTAKIFFRTHVQVTVLFKIEYGLDTFYARNAYRTRGQTCVAIGVIGAVDVE